MSLNRTAALDMLYSLRVEPFEAVKVSIEIDSNDARGKGAEVVYTLYATTAPQRYDYDRTTIELFVHDDVRLVLIDEQGAADQLARYSSGLYVTCLSADVTANGVSNMLWQRLMKKAEA